jgi:hypothetical protein
MPAPEPQQPAQTTSKGKARLPVSAAAQRRGGTRPWQQRAAQDGSQAAAALLLRARTSVCGAESELERAMAVCRLSPLSLDRDVHRSSG